ncbi:GNAT family N-acetyltransferase [Corynebacterium mendelii]|uniref:GNAT family N-acetyltransferase n=1 Tax=Corynebacterium mendelii TaxID=2765362 RepID=A0A939E2B0_9CORY|nr:GNAT family N-acetyltransferase [Corynebacterium mendelii]MBN9645165.1 GNAT family N-acetyltransferase [Corynebacterium mendelii]
MNNYFSVSSLADLSALEVHRLYKLRVDVFVHEQHCAYAEIDDIDALPTTFHVQAFEGPAGREPVGTARLFPDTAAGFAHKCLGSVDLPHDGDLWQLGRVCTAQSVRGSGLGAEILRQTLRLAHEQDPERDIVITAQVPLEDYYGRFGFVRCGEIFDWDGMDHLPMVRPAGPVGQPS